MIACGDGCIATLSANNDPVYPEQMGPFSSVLLICYVSL